MFTDPVKNIVPNKVYEVLRPIFLYFQRQKQILCFNVISYLGVIKHQRENANWYEIEKFIVLVTDL